VSPESRVPSPEHPSHPDGFWCLHCDPLTEGEERFMFRAVARNIPEKLALSLLDWQRQGVVNLSGFFDLSSGLGTQDSGLTP
jgi:hypothetical protein